MSGHKSQQSHRSQKSKEVVKIDPFNPRNEAIDDVDIAKILKRVGITIDVNDIALFQQAFVHRSYVKSKVEAMAKKTVEGEAMIAECPKYCVDLFEDSNERLEFLGDSVVGCIVVSYLYRRFPDADEGFMTKMKTRLVQTAALAEFSRFLNLGKYMIISKYVDDKCDGRTSDRMLEDLFEAFMGALFLDQCQISFEEYRTMGLLYGPGYSVCESFLIKVIEEVVDFEDLVLNDTNYKDMLMKYFQNKYSKSPQYIQISLDGPPNHRIFTMGVSDHHGKILGQGKESSKKKAEQMASREALIALGAL